MSLSDGNTTPHTRGEIAGQVSLHTSAIIPEAIVHRAQVWAILHGGPIHFCPHALGWRDEEAYVQALLLGQR